MNNTIFSFVVTILSGLSTLIGSILIFINISNKNKLISSCLFFSSSIMLFISIFDLIPTSLSIYNKNFLLIPSLLLIFIYSLFGGLLISYINKKNSKDNSLYKVGIISLIALIFHNIPEGIITYISTNKDFSIGVTLAISIALHNIPEGIAISIPIYYGENSKKKAIMFTLVAALSEPLGAICAYLLINDINDYFFAFLLSFTAGVMIYLSIFELIKEGFKYNCKSSFFFFILGIIVMILSKIII